jgi:hypothetical protein
MILGIMQPYFFPYIGYYSLINATNKWVIFDTPQYIRKGWVNRNQVLKINGGTKYICIPIKSSPRETPINKIEIIQENWKNNIINNLDYYKQVKAPRYNEVISMINEAFDIETSNLSEILINCLKTSCKHLDINFEYEIFSKMNLDCSEVHKPGDWALMIAKNLGAECYINPHGGIAIFEKEKFNEAKIDIKFIKHDLPIYNQNNLNFEPGLSIIDVMMFNDPKEIKEMLKSYKFIN